MSKDLTPLKAHKELLNRYGKHFSMQDDERARVIKRAIEENKTLKKCYENELKNSAYYNNLALKYRKALEIIKEKKWLVEDILNAFNEDKEKCDLLKEVLK